MVVRPGCVVSILQTKKWQFWNQEEAYIKQILSFLVSRPELFLLYLKSTSWVNRKCNCWKRIGEKMTCWLFFLECRKSGSFPPLDFRSVPSSGRCVLVSLKGSTIHMLVTLNGAPIELTGFFARAPVHDGLGRMETVFIGEIGSVQDSGLAVWLHGHSLREQGGHLNLNTLWAVLKLHCWTSQGAVPWLVLMSEYICLFLRMNLLCEVLVSISETVESSLHFPNRLCLPADKCLYFCWN